MATYLESTTHDERLRKGVEYLLETGKFADVTFVVDGRNFPAHKAIMCSMVPYFHTMFSNNMRESRQKKVKIQDVDVEIFENLMNFVYKGGVDFTISNVWDVVKLADMWDVDGLIDLCHSYLEKTLTAENCLEFWEKSETFSLPQVTEWARSCALDEFEKIKDSENLLGCEFDFLHRYLTHSDLNVQHEEDVATAVLRWIKHDEKKRKKHLFKLLQSVRLTHLDMAFLQNGLRKNEMVKQNEKCRRLVEDVLSYKIFGGDEPDVMCTLSRPSTGMETTIVAITSEFFGIIELTRMHFIRLGSPDNIKVTTDTGDLKQAEGSAACVVGRNMYVSGLNGQAYAEDTDYIHMWKYDSAMDKWQTVGEMSPSGRRDHVMLPVDDKLYILGGQEPENISRRVDCYDIRTNLWTECRSLQQAVWKHVGVVYESKIYLMGGMTGLEEENPTTVVQEFDALSKKTRLLAPFPKACDFSSAVWYQGKVIVLARFNGVFEYDIQSNIWNVYIRDLPNDLLEGSHRFVLVNKTIYIVGTSECHNLTVMSKPIEDILSDNVYPEWQNSACFLNKPEAIHLCNVIVCTTNNK